MNWLVGVGLLTMACGGNIVKEETSTGGATGSQDVAKPGAGGASGISSSPSSEAIGGNNVSSGASATSSPPSCQPGGPGMTDCGPGGSGTESCCTSLQVPGGTFYRQSEGVAIPDTHPVTTVSDFRLDRYEITVGRFRQFVNAVIAGWLPSERSGQHPQLDGEQDPVVLSEDGGLGHADGWNSAWNTIIPSTASDWNNNLMCNSSPLQTWTPSPGNSENRPINCVNWYELYAFCIWDGGFLPSDVELNYAASGGSEQREYPWSSPPTSTSIDCTYANYGGSSAGPADYCVAEGVNNVGTESPKGDGKWGQADLGGNVWEWESDGANLDPCGGVNCVLATPLPPYSEPYRITRGGGLGVGIPFAWSPGDAMPATERDIEQGGRCARAP